MDRRISRPVPSRRDRLNISFSIENFVSSAAIGHNSRPANEQQRNLAKVLGREHCGFDFDCWPGRRSLSASASVVSSIFINSLLILIIIPFAVHSSFQFAEIYEWANEWRWTRSRPAGEPKDIYTTIIMFQHHELALVCLLRHARRAARPRMLRAREALFVRRARQASWQEGSRSGPLLAPTCLISIGKYKKLMICLASNSLPGLSRANFNIFSKTDERRATSDSPDHKGRLACEPSR